MIEIEFHADARQELRQAAQYYERQVAGLGFAFTDEVERTVELIQESPGIGSPVWQYYRRVFVRRFPYSVVYREFENKLFVVAVAHHRRRPNYWRVRT